MRKLARVRPKGLSRNIVIIVIIRIHDPSIHIIILHFLIYIVSRFKNRTVLADGRCAAPAICGTSARAEKTTGPRPSAVYAFDGNYYTNKNPIVAAARPAVAQSIGGDSCRCRSSPTRLAV